MKATARTLHQRLRHGLRRRIPHTDTLTLTPCQVCIRPTRAGLMLGLTLLVLLMGSINEQLNLGYLLTFLLTGCAVAGMYLAHRNLLGLTLHLTAPAPVHTGQAVLLGVRLANERRYRRVGIGVGVGVTGQLAWTDAPAQGSSTVQVAWTAPGRGRHALPLLQAASVFPLGTFRVWTVWQPAAQVLVYPAPEVQPPPWPAGTPESGGAGLAQAHNTIDFDSLRAYRRGDPPRSVAWKKAARSFAAGRNDLVSRDTPTQRHHRLWLDHAQCGASAHEARLSRLTAWVLQAERQGLDYGLRLPGFEIAPDRGPAHLARCLEALALC